MPHIFLTLSEKERPKNLEKLQHQKTFPPVCMLLILCMLVCILTSMLLLFLKPVF